VPSYDRARSLQHNTLTALAEAGVGVSTKVDVFVATEQEAEKYDRALAPGSYATIQVGVLGIGKQRDHILDHYGAGSNVVMLDDDILAFLHGYEEHYNLNLHRAIQKGFELSQEHGCYLWGINNVSNTYFMRRHTYTVGWCFFQVSGARATFKACVTHMICVSNGGGATT
jgi:hypothetical protein